MVIKFFNKLHMKQFKLYIAFYNFSRHESLKKIQQICVMVCLTCNSSWKINKYISKKVHEPKDSFSMVFL